MDTLLFYFLKSSYSNLFRGVAECYAFSCFHDNVGLRDFPAIRHIESADAVVVDHDTLIGNAVLLAVDPYPPLTVNPSKATMVPSLVCMPIAAVRFPLMAFTVVLRTTCYFS